MDIIHYIIGDIHGQAQMLEDLLAMIQSHHQWKYPELQANLVYLGDYIDRGPDSKAVIDLVMAGLPSFSSICLKGNHEDLLWKCLHNDERSHWNNWMSAGGEVTLKSFGYDLFQSKYNAILLKETLGKKRINWLSNLELTYQYSDFICVHAGFTPGISIEDQNEHDMLWIRRRFLEGNHKFGYGVIHGHTPNNVPVIRPNRICLDTGAGVGGELTALVVNASWEEVRQEPKFLSVR